MITRTHAEFAPAPLDSEDDDVPKGQHAILPRILHSPTAFLVALPPKKHSKSTSSAAEEDGSDVENESPDDGGSPAASGDEENGEAADYIDRHLTAKVCVPYHLLLGIHICIANCRCRSH